MPTYEYTPFPYVRPPELDDAAVRRHPVAIVGAGPIGLAAAIDLATRGVASMVLDDNDVVSVGSRAICWSKRTLEIFDRLGVGDRMVEKGVTWKIGRVYHGARELYTMDLLPEDGHKMPAFINLQQYYVEQYLVERALEFPELIDLRWKNKVTGIDPRDDHVGLTVDTPDGRYEIEADWVLAADGGRSAIREMLGLPFEGVEFEERFLIADIHMDVEFPNERRFWFEPEFDPAESVLLHRQPDNVYRIDFQLGWNTDPEREKEPENVLRRVRRVVGPDVEFELEWCSVYTFRCARMERFRHGHVLFVGDSAHVVSPFGARGGNGGIQDVDNLVWKLALVLDGKAPDTLLDSYDAERVHGSDENIMNSRRTTKFMTPKTATERLFRDSVLALAEDYPFAQRLVNGGRLSRPCSLAGFPLQTPDRGVPGGPMSPGEPCMDAPMLDAAGERTWLLNHMGGSFKVMVFAETEGDIPEASALPDGVGCLVVATRPLDTDLPQLVDVAGFAADRYGKAPGVTYLIRPDQHVAARFATFDREAILAALDRAAGRIAA